MAAAGEQAWQQWVLRRDPQAFNGLVRQYAGMVYATCLRTLGNPADAEDMTQECFEALVREAEPTNVRVAGAWLHGTATYRSLTRLRSDERRKRREAAYAAGQAGSTEPRWEDVYAYVDEAIAELPDETRIPIVQHFLCGRTQREVARELDVPRSTVGLRIGRGLGLLGDALRKRGIGVQQAAVGGLLLAICSQAEAVPASLAASLGKLALAQTANAPAAVMTQGAAQGVTGMVITAKTALVVAGVLAVIVALPISVFVFRSAGSSTQGLWAAEARGAASSARSETPPTGQSAEGALADKGAPSGASPDGISTIPVASNEAGAGSISGRVVDEDGLPATDVCIGLSGRIALKETPNGWQYSTQAPAPADQAGWFRCPGLKPGKYDFFFCPKSIPPPESPEMIRDTDRIPVVHGPEVEVLEGQEVEGVEVIVPSRRYAVAGTVRDERGRGIAGARVVMFLGLPAGVTQSDADGHFCIDRVYPYRSPDPLEWDEPPVKRLPIAVTHPDYEDSKDLDTRLGVRDLDIVLHEKRRGWILGAVVDADSGEPIPGAKAWLAWQIGQGGDKGFLVTAEHGKTWEKGYFVFPDVPAGSATLCAHADGYALTCLKDVAVIANQGTEDVRIPMERSGVVFVKGDFSGNIPECRPHIEWVYAYEPDGERDVQYEGEKLADDTYRLDLAPGQYEVGMIVNLASDPDRPREDRFCQATRITVATGRNDTVELIVGGTSSIRGAVTTPDGDHRLALALRRGAHDAPVPEEYASKRGWRPGGWFTQMPKDGLFACGTVGPEYGIGCLEPGTYTVTAMACDDATEEIRQQSKVVTLSDGEAATADFAF